MNDKPDAEEQKKWHRYFAIECNNRAWTLADAPQRSDAEVIELLDAAHAAALHWRAVGAEVNFARADMLLGKAHALAGSALGLAYAQRSFDFLTAQADGPDWERAFAHAVLAHAAHAAGKADLHAIHYARAAELGKAIAEDEERQVFEQSFGNVPKP